MCVPYPAPRLSFHVFPDKVTEQDVAPDHEGEQELMPDSPMTSGPRAMSVPATMGGRKTPLRDERSGARTTTTFLTE